MGFGAPRTGQARQPDAVTECGQVGRGGRVIQVGERGVEPRCQHEGIENFADPAHGFGGLAALVVSVEHVQGTSQAVPGSPVLGNVGQGGLKRVDRAPGLWSYSSSQRPRSRQ